MKFALQFALLAPALIAWSAEFSSSKDLVDIGVIDIDGALQNYWSYINQGGMKNGGYWSEVYRETFVDGSCNGGRGQEVSFRIEIIGTQLQGTDYRCDYGCLRQNSWGLLQDGVRKIMSQNQRPACTDWFCKNENCPTMWEKSVKNSTEPVDAVNRCTCMLWDGNRVQAKMMPRYSRVYLTGEGKSGSFEIRISEHRGSASVCQLANFANTWVGILGGQAGAIISGAGGQITGEWCQ